MAAFQTRRFPKEQPRMSKRRWRSDTLKLHHKFKRILKKAVQGQLEIKN